MITINPDSTFEFRSRPHISCVTWNEYKGTWTKKKDTLFFSDNYEVNENDVRVIYKKASRQSFNMRFKTDKNSELRNKSLKVEYIYDCDAHLNDLEKVFNLSSDNTLEIPFKDVPHIGQLAAISIEYQLSFKEKKYTYLTKNDPLNIKKRNLPNSIEIEFVEKPKKETVYRTSRGIIQRNTLFIVSIIKTKTRLPDYNRNFEFENGYVLKK